MRIRFKNQYLIGAGIGILIILFSIVRFQGTRFFFPGLLVGVVVCVLQFLMDVFQEMKNQKEYENRFLEFVRNLVSAVKSGMPVSRAITLVAKSDYGPLSAHIRKLSYQIEWSIPVHRALINFSKETGNGVIQRAVVTVIEAEEAGGNLEDVLEKITDSLLTIKKIRETRKSSVQAQTMQSYIIFLVFLGVMIVIQNMLVPYMVGIESNSLSDSGIFLVGNDENGATVNKNVVIDLSSFSSFVISLQGWFMSLNGIFLMLTVIQGFFAGIVIGKLGEGDLKSGLKHSLILIFISFFVMSISLKG